MVWIWTILARMITLGSRGVMSDKCDGTTEDGWVTDVTNENGVATRNIIEGHCNTSEEGIEDETVVNEVEMEGEHGWVVVDYVLNEEGAGWVAHYDIIEGHVKASEEGIEDEETVVDDCLHLGY